MSSCYLCGRGLTARTRARIRLDNRLILAIFGVAEPCNRLDCLRRTARALERRSGGAR